MKDIRFQFQGRGQGCQEGALGKAAQEARSRSLATAPEYFMSKRVRRPVAERAAADSARIFGSAIRPRSEYPQPIPRCSRLRRAMPRFPTHSLTTSGIYNIAQAACPSVGLDLARPCQNVRDNNAKMSERNGEQYLQCLPPSRGKASGREHRASRRHGWKDRERNRA